MSNLISLGGTKSVLFVCLGNICRSPMAEGIFRTMAQSNGLGEVQVDSAGTGHWHVGDPPDPRSIAKAGEHQIDIAQQRARQIARSDFGRFDLILAMDRANFSTLVARAPAEYHPRIHHFLTLAQGQAVDVPDPYDRDADGFETVFRMLTQGCEALQSRMV